MTRTVNRNAKGEPFSKWKPADKFAFIMAEQFPNMDTFCTREHRFHQTRKWRFDFCWVKQLVAVEIDGFGFGHQAQQCQAQDNEKANAAVELGWCVLRYNSRQLGSRAGVEAAVEQVWSVLCQRHNKE